MKGIVAFVAAFVVSSAIQAQATPPGTKVPGATGDPLAAKDLQTLLVVADDLYNTHRWDESIAVYRTIVEKAPAVTVALLQIAAACRHKGDYDQAILAYTDLLRVDRENDDARIGLGYTYLEKGDLRAAEQALTKAAKGRHPTREVFYNLGELNSVKGQLDDVPDWFEKSSRLDPSWEKPIVKLTSVRNALAHNNSR
jgi:tetratricopeptide (TPR) repeat protein